MRNKMFAFFITWLLGFSVIFVMSRNPVPISLLIYWVVLGLFIFTVWLLKLGSRVVLLFSFALFMIAGLLATFRIPIIAEETMRISFLGWLVGFIQAIFEYFFKKK